MKNDISKNNNNTAKFLIFNSEIGNANIEVRIEDEMIWLTQKLIAELFDVSVPTINEHLKKVFEFEELNENSVIRDFLITASDGKKYNTKHYNLDAIIAIGYRVNSKQATYFRIWATEVLRDFIIKGFVLDDERLKQGKKFFEKDYFKELLERIRSIRASERRIWLQITDIFAECSIDYFKDSKDAKDFYAMIQNKFHYAISGQTAAEIIYNKVDRKKENMGLMTWKNSPNGRVLKSDVLIAKNYLSEKEIKKLERTITSFFDYIERVIETEHLFKMKDFSVSVDNFLNFNKYEVLHGKGKISQDKAYKKAIGEYDEFNKYQKIDSDFEKEVKNIFLSNK